MSEDTPDITSHIALLKSHRAEVIQQISDSQRTLRVLDSLLAPHGNSDLFHINDKVVSCSAPNKNKVGLVSKVTESFIHVDPIDTKFSPYKKAHKNLIHFRDLPQQSTELTIFKPTSGKSTSPIPPSPEPPTPSSPNPPTIPPVLNSSPTSSSYSNSPHKLSPTISHLRPGRSYRTRNTSSTTTSSTTINLRQSTRSSNTTYSVRKRSRPERVPTPPSNSPIQNLAVASTLLETPSPATEKRLRLQYQIDRGLQYSGKIKPTTRITQAPIRKRLKRTAELNSLLAAKRHKSTQKSSPSNSDRTVRRKN